MYSVFVQGKQRYCLRQLHRSDFPRQREYQRLRAEIFVDQFGWQIPVDRAGCERDRYDEMDGDRVRVSCVYGKGHWRSAEFLLGGVRTIILTKWNDSMVSNEFHTFGMIPSSVVRTLEERDPTQILEITRLCLQRCHLYQPREYLSTKFHMDIARDLVYSCVYAIAQETKRHLALGITDRYYRRVMLQSNFVFEELYTHPGGMRGGYSLTLIDLSATITSMKQAGALDRVSRMLTLANNPLSILA